MRVSLAMHHKSAVITPPLWESSFYKEEPLFLQLDPTHEVGACFKLPGVRSCRNRAARPIPFPNLPFGESPAPRAFGGYGHGPVVGLPGCGGRAARAPGPVPRPASHRLPPAPAAFEPGLQPGLASRAEGGWRGRREFPCARLLGALRYPGSALQRPAQPRGGVRRADGRARGREREREREKEEAAQPRVQPRAAVAMAERRAFAQKISRYAAGLPGRVPGVGGWVWRGPRALPRGPGPAARASPGPQGVRQLGGSLCPQSRPPRRSTPMPRLRAPQQKELAWRPRRSRSHRSPLLTAPRAPRPPQRLRTHACTGTLRPQCKVTGCGTWEHPTYPWTRWALFLWPQRKMDDPTHTGLYAWAWRSRPGSKPPTKDKVPQQFTSLSR